jgi:hypothetical protein
VNAKPIDIGYVLVNSVRDEEIKISQKLKPWLFLVVL